jgi:hypothetical protein
LDHRYRRQAIGTALGLGFYAFLWWLSLGPLRTATIGIDLGLIVLCVVFLVVQVSLFVGMRGPVIGKLPLSIYAGVAIGPLFMIYWGLRKRLQKIRSELAFQRQFHNVSAQ